MKILLILVFSVSVLAFGQPGSIDPTFYSSDDGTYPSGYYTNNRISCSEVRPDGYLYIGGDFTIYNGVSRNRLVRANNYGNIDPTFQVGAGFNSEVTVIRSLPDGKLLVGGHFTTYNGVNKASLVKLNENGSIDNAFLSGSGFNGAVLSIALLPDGRIIVGGTFTTYRGVAAPYLVVLLPNGDFDPSFVTGSGFNSSVHVVKVTSSSKIMVGGAFTTYNGATKNRIVLLNNSGTIDNSFGGTGFNGTVSCLDEQSDGKFVIGGDFTSYSGTSINKIARINPTGVRDAAFTTGTGVNGEVVVIKIQPDQKILVGGNIVSYNGVNKNALFRLETNGLLDNGFANVHTINSTVRTISFSPDNAILITGGTITGTGTVFEPRCLLYLNLDGSVNTSYFQTRGIVGGIATMAQQADGKFIIAGVFDTIDAEVYNGIARLNNDGTIDPTFQIGNGFDGDVTTLVIQPDGKIIVAGYFTHYDGIACNNIVRLNNDGTHDGSFATGTGFDNIVFCLALLPDGKILAGGDFSYYNGIDAYFLARLNSNGTHDASFPLIPELNNTVVKLHTYGQDKMLVAGNFTYFDNVPCQGLARMNMDGTYDSSFDVGTGFDGSVWEVAVQSDGKIIAGGPFVAFNGVSQGNIARLLSNGQLDESYYSGTGFDGLVTVIGVQEDDKIVVGGMFSTFNGTVRNGITRIHPSGNIDASFNVGTGFDEFPSCVLIESNGKAVIGGSFKYYNNIQKGGIVRLLNCTQQTITINNGELSINSIPNTTYQWVNCGNDFEEIEGATSTTFEPTTNGSYAVVTNVNGCVSTSNCLVVNNVMVEYLDLLNVRIYPNPTNGEVHLQLEDFQKLVDISIIDNLGRMVEHLTFDSLSELTIHLDLLPGLYQFVLKTEDAFTVQKVLVE